MVFYFISLAQNNKYIVNKQVILANGGIQIFYFNKLNNVFIILLIFY